MEIFSIFPYLLELGFAKPDVGFFHEIILQLEIKLRESLMIGKDYLKNIVAAKSIGMQTILFSEIPVTEQKPSVDAVRTSMRFMVDVIMGSKRSASTG